MTEPRWRQSTLNLNNHPLLDVLEHVVDVIVGTWIGVSHHIEDSAKVLSSTLDVEDYNQLNDVLNAYRGGPNR